MSLSASKPWAVGLVLWACMAWVPAEASGPIEVPRRIADRPQLKSIYAGIHRFEEFFEGEAQAVVYVFVDDDCPVAQQYIPTLKELHATFGPQGVVFLAIYPNSQMDLLRLARHAHDQDIPFPVLWDVNHRLADLLEVQVTPEAVVVTPDLIKRYQGAIDDQYTKRGRRPGPTRRFLHDAIVSVLADEPIAVSYIPASGCPVERVPPRPPREGLTYYRDIAPLMQRHCQSCHRDGEVGPFSLETYEDVYGSATVVAEVVEERRMPPWHGELNPEFGTLRNDKRLESDEIRTILNWVASGCAEGDPSDAPPLPQWPERGSWEIGEPDFIYQMPEPFHVPKTGVLEYQFFRAPLNFTEDRWFRAVEVKPGNPEVVHHVALHLVPSGDREFHGLSGMAQLYGLNTQGGYLINDYVPGDLYAAKVYPPDQAVRIPAGHDLVYELHYTPNNRSATTDQSMVGFQWADGPPPHEVLTRVFRKPIGRFRIPPHHPHYRVEDSYYFPHDVEIDAIRPHFHLRGKSFRLEIVQRDEETEEILERTTVLSVPVWDPDWQRMYELETPLRLEAGTELLATGIFDNSIINPNNPDPSVTVHWGQQTTDEMFSTRFMVRIVSEGDVVGSTEPGVFE